MKKKSQYIGKITFFLKGRGGGGVVVEKIRNTKKIYNTVNNINILYTKRKEKLRASIGAATPVRVEPRGLRGLVVKEKRGNAARKSFIEYWETTATDASRRTGVCMLQLRAPRIG